jgi:hypothetical protein
MSFFIRRFVIQQKFTSPLSHIPNVNDVVDWESTSIEKDFEQMVPPWLVLSATLGFDSSSIFFTDGSIGEYHFVGLESSFCFQEPSVGFTSEMSAIFVLLIQMMTRRPGRFLILTDNMSSLRPLQHEYELNMMWSPSHVKESGK